MALVNPNVFPAVLYELYDQRYLNTVTFMPLSYLDTDNTLSSDSDTKVSSQKAVKYYIDNTIGGTSTDTFTSTLTIKGVEGGDATLQLWADEGDDLLDKWSIVSTAAGFLEVRNNTLTVISVSEYTISATFVDTDVALTANSDDVIPSQKAVKAYVDSSTGGTSTSADYIAGENLSKGDICYVKSDGKMWKSLASDVTKMPVVAMANEDMLAEATETFKLFGDITVDTWSWTPGSLLYAGETEGTLTHTRPSDSGDQVQVLGVAVSSTRIIFNPAMVIVEIA